MTRIIEVLGEKLLPEALFRPEQYVDWHGIEPWTPQRETDD